MTKTVSIQTIQFSITTPFSSIWSIDRTLWVTTTLGLSGSGSDDNEGVLCIPKSSSIIGTSPLDYLESYPGHSFFLGGGVLLLCREAVGVLYSPNQQGNIYIYHHHHHHHLALVAGISLTLSRHSSISFIALGRSSGQHPVSSHSCWMYVRAGRPALARPCVGIHKSTSLMSSSLLL